MPSKGKYKKSDIKLQKGTLTPRASLHQIGYQKADIEMLKRLLRTYSKTANQRLRELEKQGLEMQSNAWKAIRDYAYDSADFIAYDSKGRFKFKTNTRGMTREQLQEEVKQLHKFLFEAKTSTVKGTKAHYEKIRESIGKSKKTKRGQTKSKRLRDFFGNMSDLEFAEFWSYANIEKVMKMYGSEVGVLIVTEGLEKFGSLSNLDNFLASVLNSSVGWEEVLADIQLYEPTGKVE